MHVFTIVLLCIIILLVILLVALYIFGSKMQKKAEASKTQMAAASQTVSLLVIDKKHLRLKDANLPKLVLEQTPKYLRRSKVPIVKAKIGPKIMSLICDEKIFPAIPIKKEIKAVVSGIYIMDVKGNALIQPTKKEGFFKRTINRLKIKA